MINNSQGLDVNLVRAKAFLLGVPLPILMLLALSGVLALVAC